MKNKTEIKAEIKRLRDFLKNNPYSENGKKVIEGEINALSWVLKGN